MEYRKVMKEMDKRVGFLTLGCKVNSYETDAMVELFEKAGYEIVPFEDKAKVYIINTCTVTNMADRKSRQMLHKAKKNNKDSIVVAVGCYAQASKEDILKDDLVDIVVGNNQKKKIVSIVEDYLKDSSNKQSIVDINKEKVYEDLEIVSTLENTRAYIKIQDGCNQFCSYCIIPYVRGRIRSRKIEDVINEVKNIASNGYKEVVLTGIHLSSYGMDFENSNRFEYKYLLEAIDKISDIEGIERIRLGSLEPRIITSEFVSKLAMRKKVCPHFHLSLQSGCDRILQRMNRKYTTDMFLASCQILREYYENPAITTDVIVGFPSETDEDFSETVKFLEKVNFSQMHIFKYSRRKGTVADNMHEQIDERVKTCRSKVLQELTKKQHISYLNGFISKCEEVLFEEKVSINSKLYIVGHNERYVKMAVQLDEKNEEVNNSMQGIIKKVECTGMLGDDIILAKLV